MSKIKCKYCDIKFGIKAFSEHIGECIYEQEKNKSGYLIEFTSKSPITNKKYFIYGIFGLDCKFSDIDEFIQYNWSNNDNDSFIELVKSDNNKSNKQINFNTLISTYENKKVDKFIYNYSYTDININFKIIKKLDGLEHDEDYELIYQNEPHKLKCECHECNNNGKYIIKIKMRYFEDYNIICHECSKKIDEDEKDDEINKEYDNDEYNEDKNIKENEINKKNNYNKENEKDNKINKKNDYNKNNDENDDKDNEKSNEINKKDNIIDNNNSDDYDSSYYSDDYSSYNSDDDNYEIFPLLNSPCVGYYNIKN